MIPPLLTRPLSLQLPILNRKPITKDPRLRHRNPKQFPSIPSTSPQLLTRLIHALPLTLKLKFAGLS